jgi:hypothetical protein
MGAAWARYALCESAFNAPNFMESMLRRSFNKELEKL